MGVSGWSLCSLQMGRGARPGTSGPCSLHKRSAAASAFARTSLWGLGGRGRRLMGLCPPVRVWLLWLSAHFARGSATAVNTAGLGGSLRAKAMSPVAWLLNLCSACWPIANSRWQDREIQVRPTHPSCSDRGFFVAPRAHVPSCFCCRSCV